MNFKKKLQKPLATPNNYQINVQQILFMFWITARLQKIISYWMKVKKKHIFYNSTVCPIIKILSKNITKCQF